MGTMSEALKHSNRENGGRQLTPPALTRGIKRSATPPRDYSIQHRRVVSPQGHSYNGRSNSPINRYSPPDSHRNIVYNNNDSSGTSPPAKRDRASPTEPIAQHALAQDRQLAADRLLADRHTDRQTDSPYSNSSGYRVMTGIPQPAVPTKLTAPVHLDVGGTIYTSTLTHLTRYPESKLAKLFNGAIPITLDTMKQHYFIDRDGPSFRHILNFLRSDKLLLPSNFSELTILEDEARFYEIQPMIEAIDKLKNDSVPEVRVTECIAVSICPDMGERISLSGVKHNIEECFPELSEALLSSRNSGWIVANDYVIRFPVNGFCKLNSIQIMERLLGKKFQLVSSNGGGVEGQQFSEFIFTRKSSQTAQSS